MQRHPAKLTYRRLSPPVKLIAIGDSAYQAPSEQEAGDPLVMRGYVLALAHETERDGRLQYQLQLLDYLAGKQHHICRGVWSAELHNQCDMLDAALLQLGFLQEIRLGIQGSAALRQCVEQGGFVTLLDAFTDSYSIWSYLRSDHLKYPSEKGTFYHLAFLKELLDTGVLNKYSWCDTRDMVVDGLTKGKLDRAALQHLMSGTWSLTCAVEEIQGRRTTERLDVGGTPFPPSRSTA